MNNRQTINDEHFEQKKLIKNSLGGKQSAAIHGILCEWYQTEMAKCSYWGSDMIQEKEYENIEQNDTLQEMKRYI